MCFGVEVLLWRLFNEGVQRKERNAGASQILTWGSVGINREDFESGCEKYRTFLA
jgi:hypothetical protein